MQRTLFRLKDFGSQFGGELLKPGRRKTTRPISAGHPVHLVLRADVTNSGSFLKNRAVVEKYLKKFAEDFSVRIYEQALVSNHIHLTVRFFSRELYKKFIRSFTGVLARRLKVKWLLRPFTRILKWGRAFQTAMVYTRQNHLEAIGHIPYQPRAKDKKESKRRLRAGAKISGG